jgi:hypothetical protein
MSYIGNTPNDAPVTVAYITQTPSGTLVAEQALSTLSTGLLKVTTGTGVLSTAVANSDYLAANANLLNIASLTSGQTTNLLNLATTASSGIDRLIDIADLGAPAGAILATSGTTWAALTGDTARAQIGLSTTDNVTFNDINFTGRILKSSSLFCHNSGTNNTFLGITAGNQTLSGTGNLVGIGVNSLTAVTTCADTVSIGKDSCLAMTSSARTVAIGKDCLKAATGSANDCVFVGYQAGLSSNQNNNIGIGSGALTNGTASDVVAVGKAAGAVCTGIRNVFIGNGADGSGSVGTSVAIGYNASVTASNAVILGSTTCSVGVGLTAPGFKFDVSGGDINTSSAYRVGGTLVVGTRKTGWGSPTGTASRAAFDTSTVTLATLAGVVKALVDDFKIHGLIGA